MLKINFGGLKAVFKRPKGCSFVCNASHFNGTFGGVDPQTAKNYTAGHIILAPVRCTALVFV
jgi:ACR3 family arsenite efflux pump ArsB